MPRRDMGTHRLPRTTEDYRTHIVDLRENGLDVPSAECSCGWWAEAKTLRAVRAKATNHRRYRSDNTRGEQ